MRKPAASGSPRSTQSSRSTHALDDSPKIIEETRQYIRDFDRVVETTTTARELYNKMLELYPDRVNPLPLWMSARAAKGQVSTFAEVGKRKLTPRVLEAERVEGRGREADDTGRGVPFKATGVEWVKGTGTFKTRTLSPWRAAARHWRPGYSLIQHRTRGTSLASVEVGMRHAR